MGHKNRTEHETGFSDNSSSLSEALLFATMCIIGLPVDVHVKDGSVYSGIFYTASVEKDYGIVLKNAKMTKKGKSNANVANGVVIETLVILSGDLVQVVAKGVMFPADGVAGDDVEAAAGSIPSSGAQMSEAKKSTRSGMNKRRNQKRNSIHIENGYANSVVPTKAQKEHEAKKVYPNQIRNTIEVENGNKDMSNVLKIGEDSGHSLSGRQVRDDRSQDEQDACTQAFELHREETAEEVQGSSSNLPAGHPKMTSNQANGVSNDAAHAHVKPNIQYRERPTSAGTSSLNAASRISTPSNPASAVISGSLSSSLAASTEMVPAQSSETNKSSKEFKLNPEAKMFSPSFTNPISATAPTVSTVASMAYMPSNPTVAPVAAAQSEIGMSPYVPHSSVPTKFAPYGNLPAGNGGSAAQFPQPIVGHMGGRMQPVRYAGHYPVQTGPAYVQPNSQAVVVGRVGGQLVYLQPFSNDLAQGMTNFSPVSTRPPLAPHQVQFPKHQGNAAGQAMQLCMPSPLMSNGLQPFAAPGHIPVLQPPMPTNRPIPVPGSNGFYTSKFP
ncbi:hypothetical protein LWI28_017195 [Acer negundo]|uniref:Ataxin 2 SM domain-containing protein n=1 Tax=Acer negundo TaxID=4023 RepID=A0AAD5J568_ACENE|nr:hypothetical protein LWI28_017195 [Acer negundo]